MEKFPIINLSGDNRAIGLQHGEKLKSRIEKTIEFYASIFDRPRVSIFDYANYFAKKIRLFNPGYHTEITAIAEGADLDPEWIFALNARSEILSMFVSECTAIYSSSKRILAQNWDWARAMEDLAVVMRIQNNDQKILMMTEPGIIGKIGFNSAGIGVCLNFLNSENKLDGIPIHIMLRALLDSTTLERVQNLIDTHYSGKSGNILVGTDQGQHMNVEFTGTNYHQFTGTNDFIHTNHFVGDESLNIREEKLASSRARYARASKLISSNNLNLDITKTILKDRQNEELPICRHYVEDPDIGDIGTVCTIIMDLMELKMHITRGNPFDHEYGTITL